MKQINQVKLPDYLLELTDKVEESLGLISSGASVPRISIRGRQFRYIVDGDEVSKQTDPINVIILGVEPEKGMAKTYYESGYQPGSSDPPDCSSWDGIKPDTWVDRPQADFCSHCEKNIWGSAKSMTGKKAKACKESKRLMVVNAQDIESIVYIFNVTIASLKALTEYGKFLINNNVPMAAAITQIAFVDAEFPQVEFNFGGVLKKTVGIKMLKRSSDKEWKADIVPVARIQLKPTPQIEQKQESAKTTKSTKTVEPDIVETQSNVDDSHSNESIDDLLANWS